MKSNYLTIALAVIVLGLSIYVGVSHYKATSSHYVCVPSGTELCATDAFYTDYQRWKALSSEIQKDRSSSSIQALQDKTDLFTGIGQRLQGQIPQGYSWDDQKMKFVKLTPTPPAAPPPTAEKK